MKAEILLGTRPQGRIAVLVGLAVVAVAAWVWLLYGAGMATETMDMGSGQTIIMRPEWSGGYAATVFVMWTVMMVAMMLPGVVPVTLLVASIARKRAAEGGTAGTTACFVIGYLSAWTVFAAAATALQWALDVAGRLSGAMTLGNTTLAGAVLIAIGVYQWTPLKTVCLRHCRSPLDFLLFHWRDGALGAFVSGVRHGAFCLGCCWMLMLLLFVGGIMSIASIAVIAILVLVEKTLPWGGRMSRVAGGIFVVWGVATLASTL